jgi:uracil-DNA glycosylase
MERSEAPPDRTRIFASLRDYVAQLCEEGMGGLPLSERQPAHPVRPATAAARASAVPAPAAPADAYALGRGSAESAEPRPSAEPAPAAATAQLFSIYPGLDKTHTLDELREFIGDCRRCKLSRGRTNLVFGVGNSEAELMFVGEGPGAEEDARGEPFVGRAGQLLTDIIERGMGMTRADIYICNVIKCRPPENRNPEPEEVAACEPFLMRQIEIVRPKVIVGLGTFAVQSLLKVKTPISRLRGVWHDFRGIRMMPTFHPAYLLRNPADKKLVWRDIQEVMKFLGRPLPGRGERMR